MFVGFKKWLVEWYITFLTGLPYATKGSRLVDRLLEKMER
jgi:hypothetical protein